MKSSDAVIKCGYIKTILLKGFIIFSGIQGQKYSSHYQSESVLKLYFTPTRRDLNFYVHKFKRQETFPFEKLRKKGHINYDANTLPLGVSLTNEKQHRHNSESTKTKKF